MIVGLPCLASRFSTCSELIEHGNSGLLFEVGNVAEARSELANLVNGRYDISVLSNNALKMAEPHKASNCVNKLIDVMSA
jgi:glycosyltransferase involved in cell wall biosynthesis